MASTTPDNGAADAPGRARSVAKSASAFRTISEVAREIDVPQHVLRFWETKFNQIRPMKRAGGRRYYRPEDIDLLVRIRALLYDQGYTIKGAQKLLRGPDARNAGRRGARRPGSGDAGPLTVQDDATAPETVADAGDNGDLANKASDAGEAPSEASAPVLDMALAGRLKDVRGRLVSLRDQLKAAAKDGD